MTPLLLMSYFNIVYSVFPSSLSHSPLDLYSKKGYVVITHSLSTINYPNPTSNYFFPAPVNMNFILCFLAILSIAFAKDFDCNNHNNDCLGCIQAVAQGGMAHSCSYCPVDGE